MFPVGHFKREEFACKCGCGFDVVDAELLQVLERVRENFGKSVEIISGARCQKHNKKVGGAPASLHLIGKAADIRLQTILPQTVAASLEEWYPTSYGLGRYGAWTHIDVRPSKSRWSKL